MTVIQFNLRHVLSAAIALTSLCAIAGGATADQAAVRHVLMAEFDKPEARLQVEPVVVVGDAALAGWAQGERGGRALLLRHGTRWQIAMCGGDGLKDERVLRDAGIKPATAGALARGLAAAEASLPVAHRARFSTFDGLLRMNSSGLHTSPHKH
jgi:hypothetical protein